MHDNLPPPRAPLESLFSSVSLHSSPGHAMRKRRDIKALPHQDWKGLHSFFSPFFCLQAVNYLTSTHNEQCKTSQNLIKRQWRGPSADGKWLTQLIKHRGVRLNMASQSHPSAKKKKKDGICCAILFSISSLAHGTFNASIKLTSTTPIYSASLKRYLCFYALLSLG